MCHLFVFLFFTFGFTYFVGGKDTLFLNTANSQNLNY